MVLRVPVRGTLADRQGAGTTLSCSVFFVFKKNGVGGGGRGRRVEQEDVPGGRRAL